MVAFADDTDRAKTQSVALAPLSALRDEIAGLLTGNATNPRAAVQVESYHQRVAGALGEALQGFLDNAVATLLRIRSDLSDERQSVAKFEYVAMAGAFAAAVIVLSWILTRGSIASFLFSALRYPDIVWAAIGGGTLGAVFSIATGIRSRTLLLELRYRDNATDAGLRILVGAIGAAVLVSLQRAGVITGSLLGAGPGESGNGDTIYFILGFIAGFSERLVPDMLAKMNVDPGPPPAASTAAIKALSVVAAAQLAAPADAQDSAAGMPSAKAANAPDEAAHAPAANDADSSEDDAEGEDCLCDGLLASDVAPTADVDLPQAAGGVATRAA